MPRTQSRLVTLICTLDLSSHAIAQTSARLSNICATNVNIIPVAPTRRFWRIGRIGVLPGLPLVWGSIARRAETELQSLGLLLPTLLAILVEVFTDPRSAAARCSRQQTHAEERVRNSKAHCDDRECNQYVSRMPQRHELAAISAQKTATIPPAFSDLLCARAQDAREDHHDWAHNEATHRHAVAAVEGQSRCETSTAQAWKDHPQPGPRGVLGVLYHGASHTPRSACAGLWHN